MTAKNLKNLNRNLSDMAEITLADRIKSILAFLSLLTGPALSNTDSDITSEIYSVIDFAENPTLENLPRLNPRPDVRDNVQLWGVCS